MLDNVYCQNIAGNKNSSKVSYVDHNKEKMAADDFSYQMCVSRFLFIQTESYLLFIIHICVYA